MNILSAMAGKQGQNKADSPNDLKTTQNFRFFVLTLIILLLNGLYLQFAWNRYVNIASYEAVQLVESLESIFHPEHIAEILDDTNDTDKPGYILAKNSLTKLVETINPIHFAYIYGERDGNLIFLFDSEPINSPDYVSPGQIYEEADDIHWEPFRTGESVLTKPITDRWGTWISALAPVKDPSDGTIISVFAIDFSASEWFANLRKQMIPDIVISICILILYFAFIHIRMKNIALRSLNKKISYNEALYRSVFSQAPIGIAIINDQQFIPESEFGQPNINPMFKKILGRTSEDLETITWPELTHPEDLQADMEKYEQFKNGEISGYSMKKRFVRPDGTSVWTNMKVSPLIGLPYKHSMHLCLLEDITISMATFAALSESERSKAVFLSHLPGLAYRCNNDSEWTMQYVSSGCSELTGYPSESLLYNRDRSFVSIIAPEYREPIQREWKRVIESRLPFKYEYEIVTAEGERKWVLEMGQGVYNDQGEVEALEGIILDISDRKEIENNLRYINEHDGLTGLHNRRVLENLLIRDANELKTNKRAVLSINLSTVQSLTKTYGFHYAQELIKKAADVLRQFYSDQCKLFNTHTDQFVFYLKEYKDKNELLLLCESIANALGELLRTERIGFGIGVVEIDDNYHDVDELLKRLLIASEKSISSSDAEFSPCFYGSHIESEIMWEDDIKRELANIIDDDNDGGLYLQYQPILDLRSNQICGFEALSRLKSNKLGLVSPLEFIPLAEETKLIIPIGQKIVRQALRFLKRLEHNGYKNLLVSINVSVIQLLRSDFVENLFEMIDEFRVNPKNVGIELTESIFSDDYDEVNRIINKLRNTGICVAIDDFGTGYSSLARECEWNVDCVKIDKHFIDKLTETHPDKTIASDIVSMTHKLGHCSIAEGVEDKRQLQYLKKWNCDMIQGYFISKPLDEEKAIEFLSKQSDW